jgi:FkbM family methyltransferase
MLSIIKKLLPSRLKMNVKDHLGVPSLSWTLKNLVKVGYVPRMVLDIGAYEGYWTEDFLSVFPDARILMFEAQESKRQILSRVLRENSNVELEIALLSSKDDELVQFEMDETNSRIEKVSQVSSHKTSKTKTLTSIFERNKYPLPDFVKIDIQGHEIEAMKGGEQIIRNAEFVLLECTVLDLGNNPPMINEVFNYMDALNFQLYDISQFMRRPSDKALFQIDALFIKKDSQFISSRIW